MPEHRGGGFLHYGSEEHISGVDTGTGLFVRILGPFLARLNLHDPQSPDDPFILELQIAGDANRPETFLILDEESAAEVPFEAWD